MRLSWLLLLWVVSLVVVSVRQARVQALLVRLSWLLLWVVSSVVVAVQFLLQAPEPPRNAKHEDEAVLCEDTGGTGEACMSARSEQGVSISR